MPLLPSKKIWHGSTWSLPSFIPDNLIIGETRDEYLQKLQDTFIKDADEKNDTIKVLVGGGRDRKKLSGSGICKAKY